MAEKIVNGERVTMTAQEEQTLADIRATLVATRQQKAAARQAKIDEVNTVAAEVAHTLGITIADLRLLLVNAGKIQEN